MNPRREHRPRSGLVVPVLTVLDENGELLESDQRALVRYVSQGRQGADVVYAASAVGERERLSVELWRVLVRVCVEEVAKVCAAQGARGDAPEAWAGITASTRAQTLENLVFAIECGVDAVVLAPLAIRDVDAPVRFVKRDVAAALEQLGSQAHGVSLYLDDEWNAAAPGHGYIHTRLVRALSQLGFVRGIAASGTSRRLGSYARAAAGRREPGTFGIYASEPQQIFDHYRERSGFPHSMTNSWARRHTTGFGIPSWTRRQFRAALPTGVMAASANAFPREWARAWQACRAGDAERIESCRELLEMFRVRTHEAGGRRTIACYKRALQIRGVISTAAVAPGTPPLRYPDVDRFDRAFEYARLRADELGASFTSKTQ